MRAWVSNMTDKTHQVICLIVTKFNWQYFELESAGQFLRHGVMGFLEDCLDLRLRHIINKIWRPIASLLALNSWQQKWVEILYPCFSLLIRHTYQRLTVRWETVNSAYQSEDETGSALTKQEAFLEDVTCLLSRAHILVLLRVSTMSIEAKKKLQSGTDEPQAHIDEEQTEQENGDDSKMEEDGDKTASPTKSPMKRYPRIPITGRKWIPPGQFDRKKILPALSPMGVKMMQDEADRAALVLSIFHCLMWRDTAMFMKLQHFPNPFIGHLLEDKLLDDASVSHIFRSVIQGLKIHGEHDIPANALIILATDFYAAVRPSFPVLVEILKELPETTDEEVTSFDERFTTGLAAEENGPENGPNPAKHSEKRKRMMMKKILRGAIGINVGQQFKKNVQMRNLPPLLKPERKKPEFDDDFNLDILELFNKQKED